MLDISQTSLLLLLLILLASSTSSHLLQNQSIPLSSSSFIYTPFVCNVTDVSLDSHVCQGGWQMSLDSDDNLEVSTTGYLKPIFQQIFLRFNAPSIFIAASPESNATVDATVAWNSTTLRSTFNTSTGFTDLPINTTILLTVTVNSSTTPTLFTLSSIEIETLPDIIISSLLPSPITPSSAIAPTSFTSQTAPSSSSSSPAAQLNNNQNLSPQTIKLAIGLTVGLGVGLTLIAVVVYRTLRLRRRRRKSAATTTDQRWSFLTPF